MLATTIIIGISSIIGGLLMTGGIIRMTNHWREQRELERRTHELYLTFVDNISIDEHID